MGRAVLANADGVVRPDVVHRDVRERRHAHLRVESPDAATDCVLRHKPRWPTYWNPVCAPPAAQENVRLYLVKKAGNSNVRDRRAHVVREDQEGGAGHAVEAIEAHAVEDRTHRVLADAVVEVACEKGRHTCSA